MIFWIYYMISLAYCLWKLYGKYVDRVMPGGLGISPGLDLIALIILCWALAPVDIVITLISKFKR